MAGGLNEVNTSVDTIVNNVDAVDFVLSLEVCVETLFDVFDNRIPRLVIVDKITKAWSVDHSQAKADTVLVDICAGGLDGDSLRHLITRAFVVLGRVQRGVEQGVDQG